MASGSEDESLTDTLTFDVANTCQVICCCGQFSQMLILEPEEAVLKSKNLIAQAEKRMPYGELGSVQHITACGCCHSFGSNLSPKDEHGRGQAISPGCGCEADLVAEIVEELKARMKGRGDTGNIKRAEDTLRLMRLMELKMDALMGKLQVAAPSQENMDRDMIVFEHKDYDVTNNYFRMCTCCMGHQQLNLEHEEANLNVKTCCSNSTERRPYGQLGSVDEAKQCGCCVLVSSNLGMINPGWGCEEDVVSEIVVELKQRMKARGDTGNIQRQEATHRLLQHQDIKLNMLLSRMGVQVPQVPEVPSQKVMG